MAARDGESVADFLNDLANKVQEARDAIEDSVTERFRKALMAEHHHWTMEVVSEAAHICARSLVAAFFDESDTGGTGTTDG